MMAQQTIRVMLTTSTTLHEIEMAVFEIIFHMADMNEDENLNGDELDRLIDAWRRPTNRR